MSEIALHLDDQGSLCEIKAGHIFPKKLVAMPEFSLSRSVRSSLVGEKEGGCTKIDFFLSTGSEARRLEGR